MQYEFYSDRLPMDVYDALSLRNWLQTAPREVTGRLHMNRADLLPADTQTASLSEFPQSLEHGELSLDLDYRFEPGEADDGLSITVPRETLGQLNEAYLEWMVPGLLEEKLVALIRRPAQTAAARAAARPRLGTARRRPASFRRRERFWTRLRGSLAQLAGEPIPPDAFALDKLPQHLRMNIRVVDEAGIVGGAGP